MSVAGFALILLAAASPAQTPSAAARPPVEDIVVTGLRGTEARKASPDAVEFSAYIASNPPVATLRFDEPSVGPRWTELDETERRQFKIEDADIPAYAMDDEARAQRLWLKFERLKHKGNTEEHRCTLLVMGGRDHGRFVNDMSSLFAARRRSGMWGIGRDRPPWPAGNNGSGRACRRGSQSWKAYEWPRGERSQWLLVFDVEDFYNSYNYIMGDMKSRRGPGTAVTMLTFAVTTRPRRQTASKPRTSAAASFSSAAVASPR